MALTVRQNGSAAINIIQAQWFNDFLNLFTGVMTDQFVKFANSLTLTRQAMSPATPTVASVAGGSMGVGLYQYAATWVNSEGAESPISSNASITTTSSNKQVVVSAIPTGPAGTTARNLYRTQVGGGQLYLLTSLNDNTTTSYTDSAADASLSSTYAPLYPSIGSLLLKDSSGNLNGIIGSSEFGTTYLSGPHYMSFQVPNGFEVAYIQNDGLHINGNGTVGLFLQSTNGSTPSRLTVGTAGFGVKMSNGTKIFEVKGNGNAVISGSTYSTGGSGFDGFDFAECYETDQEYTSGTVVCPIGPQKMGKCTHDGCPAASIISDTPGFLAGSPHPEYQPIAVVGKVQAKTAYNIPLRSVVCSDGRGGVRPLKPGEWAYTLGYVIEPTDDKGMVGIVIRNMLAKG